jgi:hypothetical protein
MQPLALSMVSSLRRSVSASGENTAGRRKKKVERNSIPSYLGRSGIGSGFAKNPSQSA